MIAGVLVLVGAVAAARLAVPSPPAQARNVIVLVSGRDDHGLLVQPVIALQRAPDDTTTVAQLRDGSFARVRESRGEWMHIESIANPQNSGWINDYYLRTRALRADGGGQVIFVDAQASNGQVTVAVRPVDAPNDTPLWIDSALLHEVGAR
jgi:hypothetical protein